MPKPRPLVAACAATFLATSALAPLARAQQPAASSTPPGVVATTNNPNLSVATVKLDNGLRTSRIVGAGIMSDGNKKIGSVDDLILTDGNKVTVAIISLGGFVGIGSKLVAVPFSELKRNGDSYSIPGATKESLNAMPSFQY